MATTKKFRVKHGLDASNNTISFVNDPVNAQDAATKSYVDSQGAASNSYLTATFTSNAEFQAYVANTNPRFDLYLEVANVATNTSTSSATWTKANSTITFIRQDSSTYDVILTDVGEVSNAYLTSTFTTNSDFQSFVANTNAYIATKTDDSTVLATNTELRTLIDDRIQVANATLLIDDRMQVANVISYVDTEIAALVNSAPTTLNTLNELADALGDDANFATTVTTNLGQKLGATASITLTGDVTGSGSFSSNTVSIALTDTNLANTNSAIADRMQVANVISYTTKYLEVANVASNTSTTSATFTSGNSTITFERDDSSTYDVNLSTFAMANTSTLSAVYNVANATLTFTRADLSTYDVVIDSASVEVSNTAPSGANEGDMWWDNSSGELYIYYSNNWVEAVAQDVTPYANNGTFSSSNNTITFVRTDGSQFDVVLTGVGEVTNSYVTSTFTTNTVFQSALANTNAYIASVSDSQSQYLQVANSTTFLEQSDVDQYLQVANVSSYGFATESYVDTSVAALVNAAPTTLNTLDELASALGDDANFATTTTNLIGTKASNTYVNTLLANTNAYIATKANTSMLSAYLEVANVESSSSVTVSNTAPPITANGDLWWDNADGELYIAYSNNWVEAVAQDVTPYTNNASYTSGNSTLTFVRTDGSQYEVALDLSSFGGGDVSNTYLQTQLSQYLEVANVSSELSDYWPSANIINYTAKYLEVANANFTVQSDIDTAIANLVNTAPTTLDTLNELASALGDDPNFATTVSTNIGQKLGATATVTLSGDVSGSASFSANAVTVTTTVSDDFASNTYVQRYQEVANASYITANTIVVKNPDNYHEYVVTVGAKTSAHPYNGVGSGNGYSLDGVEAPSIILAPNQTYRFDQSDASNSGHPVVFYTTPTGGSYTTGVTSSGTAGSAGAYTEIVVDEDTPQVLYYMCGVHSNMGSVASVLSDTAPQYLQVANSTSFITSTALSPYLEVANVATELADYWPSANIIAYTAKYLEVANNTGGGAANTSTTSAVLSGNTVTFTRDDSSTFTLDLSSLNTGGGTGGGDGNTTVTISNSAPTGLNEGDFWFDETVAELYILYSNNFVQVSGGGTSGIGGSSLEVGNTAPTSPSEGDMWYDTDTGIINIYVGTAWVESTVSLAVEANTSTTSAVLSNNTVTFTRADSSTFDLDLSQFSIGNTSTTSAVLSGNTATFTRADSSTFDLDLSGLSTGGGGASVTVANTAPTSPTEGDLYFDEDLGTLFIYYDSQFVEVQPSISTTPLTYNIDSFTANGSVTQFGHTGDLVDENAMIVTVDGVVQRPTTDYTVSGNTVTFGTAPSDTSTIAIRIVSGAYVANGESSTGGGITYAEATANTTATAGNKYIVDTSSSAITITLPVSATLGDEVGVMDGTGNANTNNITVDRNGHNIQGSADNLVVDVNRGAFTLVYYNTTQGWLLTEV